MQILLAMPTTPIHVRPIPDTPGVESLARGPLIGCRLVTTARGREVRVDVRRYATEDARHVVPVDLSNALITLATLASAPCD